MTINSMNASRIRDVIHGYLDERWQGVHLNNHGAFVVPNLGRTACFVEPSDTKDGRTRLDIHAPILLDIPRSPALFELIALNATNWTFGALSMYEENGLNLEFDYAILADGITSGTLNYLVDLVATTADSLAAEFQTNFGGRFMY